MQELTQWKPNTQKDIVLPLYSGHTQTYGAMRASATL